MPPIPGMRLSMMTSRGESASTATIASSPDAASPTSVIPGVARTTSLATPRNTAWSSTTSTGTSGSPSPRGPADASLSPGGNGQGPISLRTTDLRPGRSTRQYDFLPLEDRAQANQKTVRSGSSSAPDGPRSRRLPLPGDPEPRQLGPASAAPAHATRTQRRAPRCEPKSQLGDPPATER